MLPHDDSLVYFTGESLSSEYNCFNVSPIFNPMRKIVFLQAGATLTVFLLILTAFMSGSVKGQSEMMAWGNLEGIRIDGELTDVKTKFVLRDPQGNIITATDKEKQQPKYDRDQNRQLVKTQLGAYQINEFIEDLEKGNAVLNVESELQHDSVPAFLQLCFEVPLGDYSAGMITKSNGKKSSLNLAKICSSAKESSEALKSIRLESEGRSLQIDISAVTKTVFSIADKKLLIFFGLSENQKPAGIQKRIFTIHASITPDHSPVEVVLQPDNPGSEFAGFGGNFRLQNPLDPPVIQYCLDHMRVAMGRVEMPWQLWHPEENIDPVAYNASGNMHQHVKESMEMAQKLAATGLPLIISDWSAPKWAIIGELSDAYKYRYKGIYGYPLNPAKTEAIYKSIADYLVYLKKHYGVEPAYFSFNESDLGIDIRHTAKEHAEFIKGIGAYFASRGIATRLLLGDNSDASTFDFILEAMNDQATHKYIGAVSFHSWRGCDDVTLEKWASAARKLNVPLIVAEGSTDAAAWSYPDIFYENAFAQYEINLYIRLCRICQPLSILQWQLTSDYSVMSGMGIFKTTGPLTPTRRFWNLKQLASTPEGAFAIPVESSKGKVNCAAFANIARGEYAVHMVNNGAQCEVTVKGIPETVKQLDIYVTNTQKNMEKTGSVDVVNGSATFTLEEAGFTTIMNYEL